MKTWHIVMVLIVVLVLFGAPKLPEFARSLGKSLRILKEETRTLTSDEADRPTSTDDERKDS